MTEVTSNSYFRVGHNRLEKLENVTKVFCALLWIALGVGDMAKMLYHESQFYHNSASRIVKKYIKTFI